jgi:hypothetical protein
LRGRTIAMMCRTWLIRPFPARETRWRTCSPDETSRGAVPFQDAKCPLDGNRVIVATSTSVRAAPGGADAVQVHQPGPVVHRLHRRPRR